MLNEPVRAPTTVGVNVTLTVHELFCVSVAVQVVVRAKSPAAAETARLLIFPPFAVNVIVCAALVVLGAWLANVSEDGEMPTVIDTVPLPLRLIVCGLPEPDEVTVIDPARVPVAVGLKVTDIVHVAF